MKRPTVVVVVVAFIVLLNYLTRTANAESHVDILMNHAKPNRDDALVCLVLQVHERSTTTVFGGDNYDDHQDKHYFECDLLLEDGGMLHGLRIDLPQDVVQDNQVALRRGEWYVKLPGARVNTTIVDGYGTVPSSIVLADNVLIITIPGEELRTSFRRHLVKMQQQQQQHRHLIRRRKGTTQTVTQTRTLLVIRVSTLDKSPTFTVSQLYDYYFDSRNYSLSRQYSWCSANWMRFKAASAVTGSVVPLPVINVVVPGRLASFTKELLWAAAWDITTKRYWNMTLSGVANHVAFVLPPGLNNGNWVATGTVGYWRTIYNDIYGGYPNVAMHEIGHNLGMGHAAMGGNQYADTTDIMGYGDTQQFGPSRCFNGFHTWYLNWFTDRRVEVSPWNQTSTIQLAAFVDYGFTNSSQVVILKVGDLYLIYNRAKGVNVGTAEAKNQVTVAQSLGGGLSTRVAALDNTTPSFAVANYAGGSRPLLIQVCSLVFDSALVDYAVVSIGVGISRCSRTV